MDKLICINKIIVLFSIILLLISCQKRNNDPLSISVEITGTNNQKITFDNDTITTFHFKVSILNQTDSVFGFWVMSGSFWDNLKFNSDNIAFYPEAYDHNLPKLILLSPNEVYFMSGELEVNDLKIMKQLRNLKLAFILARKTEFPEYNYKLEKHLRQIILLRKKSNKDFIWCKKAIEYDW